MTKKHSEPRTGQKTLEMNQGLRLRLLGGLLVEWNGKPIAFESNKNAALLTYLAVTGILQPREKLAGLFWGEWSERRARHYLSRALWDIAKRIPVDPPVFLITPQTIAFNKQCPHSLDVEQFEQHVGQDGIPSASLPYGEFLDGFFLDDCPEFEMWVVTQRARLHALAVETLARLVAESAAQGRAGYAAGIAYARHWLELEPWREEAHRQLMNLLARSGQRSAALEQYEACCRVLAKELGVAPAQETTRLYERIRTAESTPIPNLPPHPTRFVGREEELGELTKLLADPACRLLTLVGPGGIGKTRLGLQVAAEKMQEFLHGVYFVPLAAVSSPDLIISTIADSVKFSFSGRQDYKTQLLNYLREKEMLLVLDSVEHLLDGVGVLAEILQNVPDVKMLVTSRERLSLQWEWLFEVEGLRYPGFRSQVAGSRLNDVSETTNALQNLISEIENPKWTAVQLFVQCARRAQPRFSFAEEAPFVMRICQLVEGMPLGIEMTAAWVRELPCRDIPREIERGLDFLKSPLRDVPTKHRSLRAVFDHSWNLLSEEEGRAFSRLSVFRGGFREEAAQVILSDGCLVSSDAPLATEPALSLSKGHSPLVTLSALVGKSLLRRNPSGRYDMHELVRQYAEEKLVAIPEEKETAHERHCVYYAEFLHQREEYLTGAKQKEALSEIGEEIDNVRTGWRWGVERGREVEIARALESIYLFYDLQSRFQEGKEAFGAEANLRVRAGALAKTGKEILGRVLARQGHFCHRLGLYEQAETLLQESLTLLRRIGTRREIAFALSQLGDVAERKGEYGLAEQRCRESLALYQEVGDHKGLSVTLSVLALTVLRQGKYTAAKELYQQSLILHREIGDRRGIAASLSNLGTVAGSQGEYVEAEALFQECLMLFREVGDRWGLAQAHGNLGAIAYFRGSYAQAKEHHQESLALFREIGDVGNIARALINLGETVERLSSPAEARQHYQESLALQRTVADRRGVAMSLSCLGRLAHALGDDAEARRCFDEALQTAMDIQAIPVALEVLVDIAEVQAARNRPTAITLLTFALEHPAARRTLKDRAERLFKDLASQLSADVVAEARERGRARKLEEVVEEIFWNSGSPVTIVAFNSCANAIAKASA